MAADTASPSAPRHRPKATTVFAAAFVAGAVAAVVVNRVLDVRLAQAKPQVESEPIFVTLRPLAQGAPVTVWDVALRDWPRAMLPATALRASDSFSGSVLKYPLRAGQPLLSVHLVAAEPAAAPEQRPPIEEAYVPPPQARPVAGPARPESEADPWMPGATASAKPAESKPAAESVQAGAERLESDGLESVTGPSPGGEAVVAAPVAGEPSEETATASTRPADVAVTTESAAAEIAATEHAVAEPSAPAPTAVEPTLAADHEPVETESPETAPPAVTAETAPVSGGQTEVAEPTPSAPAVPRQARLPTDIEAALDVPSRPAVDLDSLPSVMARTEEADEPAQEARAAGAVRYLVVPERIARQADTLFAVPEAPAVERSALPAAATPAPSNPQPEQPAATNRRQPQRPAAEQRQQRTGSTAASPPASTQRSPTRPAAQPPAQGRSPLGPRAWGGMFPNLSAGAEAIGNRWRGGEPVASDPAATDRPRK